MVRPPIVLSSYKYLKLTGGFRSSARSSSGFGAKSVIGRVVNNNNVSFHLNEFENQVYGRLNLPLPGRCGQPPQNFVHIKKYGLPGKAEDVLATKQKFLALFPSGSDFSWSAEKKDRPASPVAEGGMTAECGLYLQLPANTKPVSLFNDVLKDVADKSWCLNGEWKDINIGGETAESFWLEVTENAQSANHKLWQLQQSLSHIPGQEISSTKSVGNEEASAPLGNVVAPKAVVICVTGMDSILASQVAAHLKNVIATNGKTGGLKSWNLFQVPCFLVYSPYRNVFKTLQTQSDLLDKVKTALDTATGVISPMDKKVDKVRDDVRELISKADVQAQATKSAAAAQAAVQAKPDPALTNLLTEITGLKTIVGSAMTTLNKLAAATPAPPPPPPAPPVQLPQPSKELTALISDVGHLKTIVGSMAQTLTNMQTFPLASFDPILTALAGLKTDVAAAAKAAQDPAYPAALKVLNGVKTDVSALSERMRDNHEASGADMKTMIDDVCDLHEKNKKMADDLQEVAKFVKKTQTQATPPPPPSPVAQPALTAAQIQTIEQILSSVKVTQTDMAAMKKKIESDLAAFEENVDIKFGNLKTDMKKPIKIAKGVPVYLSGTVGGKSRPITGSRSRDDDDDDDDDDEDDDNDRDDYDDDDDDDDEDEKDKKEKKNKN